MRRSVRRRVAARTPGVAASSRASAIAALALLVLAARGCSRALAAEAAAASTGQADPALVHLDYRRDPRAASCVSAPQLVRDVEARLGRRVFVAPADAELTARVRARRVARRFVVELELFDRDRRSLGRRELSTHGAHCSALDDSLALVLALAADMPRQPPLPEGPAAAPAATAPAATAPAAGPAPAAASLGSAISIPATTHAPRLGVRVRPSLGAAAALGLAPGLAPGLELGFALRANQFWPVVVHGAGFLQQDRGSSVPAKGATFALQTLLLGVCPWTEGLGAFEASACALQCLGRVRARGVGFDEEQRDDGWSLHIGAGLGLSRAFGPLFVGASGALLVPVVRRRYFFTDDVDITLYEQPWLGGLLALRVGTEI
jgi:hypothetical protein